MGSKKYITEDIKHDAKNYIDSLPNSISMKDYFSYIKQAYIQGRLEQKPDLSEILPSDKVIEANGVEGGLRDGELQMFYEGAIWCRNHIKHKLQGRLEQKPDSEYYKEVIIKAQDVLARYIVPNGISKDECIELLMGILDSKELYRALNHINK